MDPSQCEWAHVFDRSRHPNTPRLDAAIHCYILAKRAEGVADSTSANHAYQLRHLQNWSAAHNIDLPSLTADYLRAFFNTGREHSAPAHWQAAKCVKAFFAWCAAENISTDLTANIRMPRRVDKPPDILTHDQLRLLLAACTGESFVNRRDDALIRFLIDAMLRISELVGLNLADIDIAARTARVRCAKGGRQRNVYFGERTAESLSNYLQVRDKMHPMDDAVFVAKNGRRLNRHRARKQLDRLAKRAGLTGIRVSPHRLRHTGATLFIAHGGGAFPLQKILGHSTMTMTKRYVSLADGEVEAAHRHASPGDLF